MIPTIQLLVVLLVVIAAVAVLATRLKIPPAILLVLTGVALALVPGLPAVRLAPEFVLLIILPPLVYSSAVAMSWREFRFNLRPISLLAIGCVLFTTFAAAAVTHWLLGFSWPAGFVLGAIVSPPDPVAPLSIARRMQLPRRLLVILEGEGLANDASALIIYRLALAAVGASAFSFSRAAGMFAAILCGEVLWGMAVGWLMLRLRRWVNDSRVEIALSILTPFAAFWPPQHLGGSGVLATVTAGLYISWNGLRLISAPTRLQGVFFWDLLMYLIEGFVFLITGLQARTLVAGIHGGSFADLVRSAAIVCAAVIIARFTWMFPATYLPRWLIPSVARADPAPPWQWPFALAFTGVRGIVSLAAALAIPLTAENGALFPNRDRILFITFSVILVTLVGQGLMLPAVIRALGLAHAGRREQQSGRVEELAGRRQAIESALRRLEELAAERSLTEDVAGALRSRYRDRLRQVEFRADSDAQHARLVKLRDEVEVQLIAAEREKINVLYRRGELKDEARRRIERELDLRDALLTSARAEE
ncbi:MAG TPA: Na+/H+ antiporter [Steroidobacteraceae bacterium]|nr:Na+/H+ antiporter [Steroidobacteraceae bacterium]